MKFEQELIARMIKHLADKFNVNCTPEEAEEHLRSLADLYLAINRASQNGSFATTPLGEGEASLSLGSSNTQGTMQNETKHD
jgi:hypothetical protein